MSNDFCIQFACTGCEAPVALPMRSSVEHPWVYTCPMCGKVFQLNDSVTRQLQLFIDLCAQLEASEEILSNTSVAVTVGSTEVKLPYKLLLTRCRTTFEFSIDGRKVIVSSRMPPIEIAKALSQESFDI